MANKRQMKFRIKNRYCWECNVPLKPSQNRYGWNCPKCNEFYPEIILEGKERNAPFYGQVLKPD